MYIYYLENKISNIVEIKERMKELYIIHFATSISEMRESKWLVLLVVEQIFDKMLHSSLI